VVQKHIDDGIENLEQTDHRGHWQRYWEHQSTKHEQ